MPHPRVRRAGDTGRAAFSQQDVLWVRVDWTEPERADGETRAAERIRSLVTKHRARVLVPKEDSGGQWPVTHVIGTHLQVLSKGIGFLCMPGRGY